MTAPGGAGHVGRVGLADGDRRLLMDLLGLPTAGPLETGPAGPPPRLWEAQRAYAAAAAGFGMTVVQHDAPDTRSLPLDCLPSAVREAAGHPGFLDCQPSLVLRLGPVLPRRATVMCNVHLDTVAGWWPARFDGRRFHGRGAIDAKGPAVALLAGIRAARLLEPAVGERVAVLIQAVSGEEGGAMGVFGTGRLVRQGHVGRLNVFCEPTGLRCLPRATAAMTACLAVAGEDAVDDCPQAGHNATALLGHLAQFLARAVPARLEGGRMCLAGLHTGEQHNRVYGSGRLLLNFSYDSPAAARRIETVLDHAVRRGIDDFRRRFTGHPDFARTAADAAVLTTVRWLKRGLPALSGQPGWGDALFARAGIGAWPAAAPGFTCDAIWMAGVRETYTAVYGPGRLDANRAHAEGEFADLADLERFAAGIARLLSAYAAATDDPGAQKYPDDTERPLARPRTGHAE